MTEPAAVHLRRIWRASTNLRGTAMPLDPQDLTANAEVLDRLSWTFDLRFAIDFEESL
jgi:hypothetical protein